MKNLLLLKKFASALRHVYTAIHEYRPMLYCRGEQCRCLFCIWLLATAMVSCQKGSSPRLPFLNAVDIRNITTKSAEGNCLVLDNGGASIKEQGFCWDTKNSVALGPSSHFIKSSFGSSSFSSKIESLEPNTIYYIRAFATNEAGIAYSEIKQFKTPAAGSLPLLDSTTSVTNISYRTAQGGGYVISAGSFPVTKKGVCWDTKSVPQLKPGQFTNNGTGTGGFASTFTGLNPGTTYYAWSYAISKSGVAFGTMTSFTTPSLTAPILGDMIMPWNGTNTSFMIGCSVISNGGLPILETGMCLSTDPNPSYNSAGTFSTSTLDSIPIYLSTLTDSTRYYFRAYAKNSKGVGYSSTTLQYVTPPSP